MEFSRQEYWSGLPFPSSGDLPYPETEPGPPALGVQNLSLWTIKEIPQKQLLHCLSMYFEASPLPCSGTQLPLLLKRAWSVQMWVQ